MRGGGGGGGANGNRTRTVFIGNISFDATEEDLRTLFNSVGTLVNLRLVVDRDTGKRKGFGFAEFSDQETAFSAVRNLNDLEFHGRALRVNLAEQDTKTTNDAARVSQKRKGAPGGGGYDGAGAGGAGSSGVGAPAAGQQPDSAHALPALDPISAYVERLGRAQMFELALQAKHFAATQPAEADRIFTANPQLYVAMHLVIDRLAGPHWPPPPTETGAEAWGDRVTGRGGD